VSSKASRAGWGAVLAGMVLAAAVVGQPPTGGEQVAAGQRSFRAHCASCHGEGGRGDGSLSEMLKVRPADLTRLARANDGRFPYDRIYRVIDGRDEVRGHGPGSMPVWGLTFLLEAPASGPEESVAARIRDLLAFLRTIQEDGRTVSRR
jgi:mono/diheme cytochrome c family protein